MVSRPDPSAWLLALGQSRPCGRVAGCLALAVSLVFSGCQPAPLRPWWKWKGPSLDAGGDPAAESRVETPAKPAEKETAAQAPDSSPANPLIEKLASDLWYRAAQPLSPAGDTPAPSSGATTARHWRHASVEELAVAETISPADLAAALANPNRVVQVNATILAVRRGAPVDLAPLGQAVDDAQARLALRCAAAEALAAAPRDKAHAIVVARLDRIAPREDGEPNPATLPSELHRELLLTLAVLATADDAARCESRLRDLDAGVRLAALQAWANCSAPLCDRVLDLRSDSDPRVRVVWSQLIAERGHPAAETWLTAMLRDQRIEVQTAAVAGLGRLGTPSALDQVHRLATDRREAIRAAAVDALAAAGDWTSVVHGADDESWRVRLVAARCLARHPDGPAQAAAARLVADPSSETQEAMIRAASHWPLEQAGPVWLEALRSGGYRTRQLAAQLLRESWPPAAEFSCDAPQERRAEVLAQLERAWVGQFGRGAVQLTQGLVGVAAQAVSDQVPPETLARVRLLIEALSRGQTDDAVGVICQELIASGPPLLTALTALALEEQLGIPPVVYQRVLPAIDPQFAILAELADSDNELRRQAARRLAKTVTEQPLTALALERLAALANQETDPEVWTNLMVAVADDPREAAARLAYAAAQQAVAEIRRRSCEYFQRHPDRRAAPTLLAALNDPHRAVVRAAVRALGQPGILDDPSPLEPLLQSPDRHLRIDAARSLAALGAPSGAPALERLTLESDPEIVRLAIAAMGELGDPVFLPTLMALVDQRQEGVDRAAAAALEALVGSPPPATTPLGVPLPDSPSTRWKAWWEAVQQREIPMPLGRAGRARANGL